MTPAEQLALAQRSYAAFSAGPDIDAVIPLYHPECEWHMGYMGAVDGADVYRGHAGLREWVSALDEGFESLATKIDEARLTGDGVLLVRSDTHARSRGTHMELSLQVWQQIAFRDGLILTVVQLEDRPPGWDQATHLILATPQTGTE